MRHALISRFEFPYFEDTLLYLVALVPNATAAAAAEEGGGGVHWLLGNVPCFALNGGDARDGADVLAEWAAPPAGAPFAALLFVQPTRIAFEPVERQGFDLAEFVASYGIALASASNGGIVSDNIWPHLPH